MESALMTGLVLIVYAGLVGGCLMLFDTIREAHRRGMARVRAYDLQQRANKTNPYLLKTRQESNK
jgi:hypothetical protein